MHVPAAYLQRIERLPASMLWRLCLDETAPPAAQIVLARRLAAQLSTPGLEAAVYGRPSAPHLTRNGSRRMWWPPAVLRTLREALTARQRYQPVYWSRPETSRRPAALLGGDPASLTVWYAGREVLVADLAEIYHNRAALLVELISA